MSTVVVGNEMRDRLLAAGYAEIRDETGRVIGRFLPEPPNPLPPYHPDLYVMDGPDISDEELERRATTGKKYTTQEVLDYLRKLP